MRRSATGVYIYSAPSIYQPLPGQQQTTSLQCAIRT